MLVKILGFGILGFLGGVIFHSIFFSLPFTTLGIASIFLTALFLLVFFRKFWIIVVAFFLLGLGFGVLRYSVSIDITKPVILDIFVQQEERLNITGTIVSEPIVGESYTEFIVKTDALVTHEHQLPINTNILVKTDTYTYYEYNDTVRIKGLVDKPEAFLTDTDRIFDYASYLGKDGVYYTMSYAETSILGKGRGFIRSLYSLKHRFLEKIYRIIPEPESGLLAGILFGQKDSLSESYEDQFRRVGLTHIVVLSGYNIALVIQLLLKILAFLPIKIRSAVAVLGIAAFALLVGGGPTVIRASIMAVFIVVADILGTQYNIKRALVIAAVVMVLINPKILYFDISFQLSFLATYGLIAFSPWLENKFFSLPKTFAIRDSAVATIAAQIMVTPLILYRIGELSLISPLVNVLVLFAVPLAMLLGFSTAVVSFVSLTLTSITGILTTYLLRYQLWIVDMFSSLSFASIVIPPFSFIFLIIMYLLIFWWIHRINISLKKYDMIP